MRLHVLLGCGLVVLLSGCQLQDDNGLTAASTCSEAKADARACFHAAERGCFPAERRLERCVRKVYESCGWGDDEEGYGGFGPRGEGEGEGEGGAGGAGGEGGNPCWDGEEWICGEECWEDEDGNVICHGHECWDIDPYETCAAEMDEVEACYSVCDEAVKAIAGACQEERAACRAKADEVDACYENAWETCVGEDLRRCLEWDFEECAYECDDQGECRYVDEEACYAAQARCEGLYGEAEICVEPCYVLEDEYGELCDYEDDYYYPEDRYEEGYGGSGGEPVPPHGP